MQVSAFCSDVPPGSRAYVEWAVARAAERLDFSTVPAATVTAVLAEVKAKAVERWRADN